MCAGSIKISFEDEGYDFLFEVIERKLGSEDFEEIVADFLR